MGETPGTTSLYRKVADDLRAAIAAGTYPPGTRLPSESDLAERYAVSRGTVRQAFAALRADGVIASRRGARRIVLGSPQRAAARPALILKLLIVIWGVPVREMVRPRSDHYG